jgi:hypothetical protein
MTHANPTGRAILLAAILWAGSGALMAKADPLPNPPLVLPDPSPAESHNLPPSLATSGTADPGRELAAVRATNPKEQDCTTLNPCAVPPPSLQSAERVPSRAPAASNPG